MATIVKENSITLKNNRPNQSHIDLHALMQRRQFLCSAKFLWSECLKRLAIILLFRWHIHTHYGIPSDETALVNFVNFYIHELSDSNSDTDAMLIGIEWILESYLPFRAPPSPFRRGVRPLPAATGEESPLLPAVQRQQQPHRRGQRRLFGDRRGQRGEHVTSKIYEHGKKGTF